MAYTGYRLWRRLSPQQRQQAMQHVRNFGGKLRGRRREPSGTTSVATTD
jgi:hypothetical protein